MGKKHRLSEIERPIDPYTTAPWEPGVPGRFATNEDDGDELSEEDERRLDKEVDYFLRKDREQFFASRRDR